jgi:SLA1 homology domain 1, SHD1
MKEFVMFSRTLFVGVLLSTIPVSAREWTDASGKFKQEADLVDFDEHLVVLKKADGHLVALPRETLSSDDLNYLNSAEAEKAVKDAASQDRTWTMRDGKQVKGRVVEYGRREIIMVRRNGKLYVNDRPFETLSELHRYVVPKLVSHFENETVTDDKAILKLLIAKKGMPLRYQAEGVMLELDDGQLFAVPLFLFATKDANMLKPGWEAWNKSDQDERRREEESTLARSLANESQKHRDMEIKLQMLQLASQWFDLWEVELMAPNGRASSLVVPGIDSASATQLALKQCPNCQVGAIRKLRRRD